MQLEYPCWFDVSPVLVQEEYCWFHGPVLVRVGGRPVRPEKNIELVPWSSSGSSRRKTSLSWKKYWAGSMVQFCTSRRNTGSTVKKY